jgi:tetratricopeptide (TPR) repeat protein
LERYAQRVEAPVGMRHVDGDPAVLAARYVWADGTSDKEEESAAYEDLPEGERQALHDRRADELEASGELTWKLGAIPWHRERGSSPEAAVRALRFALDSCIDMGFYEATVDFGYRGRRWVDWSDANLENMWAFTTKATNSLAALGRSDEAEQLYNGARASTNAEGIHMQAAYATAMLYTRHHAERDHDTARRWIQEALSYAAKIENEKQRAFRTVFYNNGLALVEMHQNNVEEALRLVTEGEELLNQLLGANEQLLHRSVLINNKAQILVSMQRYEEALAEYDRVIAIDPNYPEYYFDRGNLLSKMGRLEEAIANYTHAIEISPPFPELYYNRASAFNRLGEADRALADYNYLLEIEPAHLDGRLNRATLLLEAGDTVRARHDVQEGLAAEAQHAQLLCTLGLIEMAEERTAEAKHALMTALMIDPSMLEAHVNLSVLLFESGDAEGAVDSLTRALEHHREADVLFFNRAWALQSLGRWQEAVEDYSQALLLGSSEAHEILFQRGTCLLELGRMEQAFADWKRHLQGGESPYVDTIRQVAPSLV